MYPSLWQILIILLILLLLFGHKRIRELGKSLGEALRDFKKGLDGGAHLDGGSNEADSHRPNGGPTEASSNRPSGETKPLSSTEATNQAPDTKN